MRYLFAILWAAAIFAVSSVPGDKLPEVASVFDFDKLAHLGVYLVLGLLAATAAPDKPKMAWIVLVFCLGYGITDELHQAFVPFRTVSFWDWMADAVGSSIGVGMVTAIRKRRAGKAG